MLVMAVNSVLVVLVLGECWVDLYLRCGIRLDDGRLMGATPIEVLFPDRKSVV